MLLDAECKACIVHCMDHRIQPCIDSLVRQLKLSPGEYDRVSHGGGPGFLEHTIQQVELSCKLHRPEQLVLSVHDDCGAGATRQDLFQAMNSFKHRDLQVSCYYLRSDGVWELCARE